MADLSYFEEDYESLVSEAVYDEFGEIVTPAIFETLTRFKPRPEQVTQDRMMYLIDRYKGLHDDLLDNTFIPMRLDDVQWDWLFLDYFVWQENEAQALQHNIDFPEDLVIVPIEPIQPSFETVENWKILYHLELRTAARPDAKEQLLMQYQDHPNWLSSMADIDLQYPAA